MTNIFEQATRTGLRFNIGGVRPTESLWSLPLEVLDENYQQIMAKSSTTPSLLGNKGISEADALRCAIINHIITVRLEEIEVAQDAAQRRAKRERIMELVEQKQNEALSSKSVHELLAMIEEL